MASGAVRGAAQTCMDAFGPEVFGFLVAVLDDARVGRTVYADVTQRIESELKDFRWTCSLRTWMYWIARRELDDRRRRTRPAYDAAQANETGCDPAITESNRPAGAVGSPGTELEFAL